MVYLIKEFKIEYGEDLAAMDQLWVDERITPYRLESYNAEFFEKQAALEGGIVKILLEDEEPVGFIWGNVESDNRPLAYQPEGLTMGYLDSIYIKKKHRGKGLGRELVREFERSCEQAGCSHIELKADYLDLDRIQSFYRSLGFSPIIVQMRKDLG